MNITIDQALLQAVEAHQSGKLQDAERLYRAILEVQPKHPDANHNLGVLAVGVGKTKEALPYLKTALEADPLKGQFWFSYIDALIAVKQVAEAKTTLEEGKRHGLTGETVKQLEQKFIELPLEEEPSQQEIDSLLSHYNSGNLSSAEELSKKLTHKFPNYPFGWKVLGAVFKTTGRIEDSLEPMRQAVQLDSNDAEAHSNLGVAFYDLGRLREAQLSYREAIRINPGCTEAHNNLGNALFDLGELHEAEASYREAIRLKPDYAEAHSNLGNMLKYLGQLSEAESSCREAIRLKPNYAEAHNNLGNALRDLGRLTEAEVSYLEAIGLKPDYAAANSNLGVTQKNLGRLEEAEASYRKAIRLKPDYAEAHWNRSLLLLLSGIYLEGWALYEWRFKKDDTKNNYYHFPQLAWRGQEDICGKRLLIHSEQGLGDTIQFCRYVKRVNDLGAKVIFEVQAALMPLLANLDGNHELISKGQSLPDFDYHCPLISLPLAFKTDLNSIPAPIPYLYAQPERIRRWEELLGNSGFKVGISWKGAKRERSILIEFFYDLSQIPGVRLISLQKGDGEKDLDKLPAGMSVETLGAEFDSNGAFMDTAAVMKCCDLVITNDTSIAHLAGALGVTAWIALLFSPDWRWMLDRNDTPWYPTVRLFRQKTIGNWKSVFDEIGSTLLSIV